MKFVVPSLLGLASAGMLTFGILTHSWWIGLGLVLFFNSLVLSAVAYDYSTALMVPVSSDRSQETAKFQRVSHPEKEAV